MIELPRPFGFLSPKKDAPSARAGQASHRVGVAEGAIGDGGSVAALCALFPQADFGSVPAGSHAAVDRNFDTLILSASARSHSELEAAVMRLRAAGPAVRVAIVLHEADVSTTRALIREGAADVLPAPVTEPALAICLERIFAGSMSAVGGPRRTGEVTAFLKAGGGVGATALATQLAVRLVAANRSVCVADLDLQFGAVGLYLDTPEAMAITDGLRGADSLEDTPYAVALAEHPSGVRIMAAPRQLTPLEILAPAQVELLMAGLRRDFALSLIDLPSVWTAWTSHALTLADRIVLVTHLSVPHIDLVKRQLRALATQGLEDKPLVLVCNSLSVDQQSSVTMKAAERAIGRPFDVVLPEDRRTMTAAINQGVPISSIRRGTKLEKSLSELGDKIAASAPVAPNSTEKR